MKKIYRKKHKSGQYVADLQPFPVLEKPQDVKATESAGVLGPTRSDDPGQAPVGGGRQGWENDHTLLALSRPSRALLLTFK